MEEAGACKWCWEKPVSARHAEPGASAVAVAMGQRPLTQLGRTAQSWAMWELEPQAKEQACALHKVTFMSGHPHGYVHMAQDREEHPLSHVHPPAPHDQEPVSWGWASRLWELRPCHHVQGLSTDTPFLCLNDRYLSAGPGRPLHLTGVGHICPGCCLPLHGAPLLNPSARGTLGAQEGGTPKPV